MKVLIIGSGGREHAIVKKLSESKRVDEIYCAPGNAGISRIANCVNIDAIDIESLKKFALENDINLTIVGPESPLVQGIVDEFEKAGLKIFGPNKKASLLEGSKYFMKKLLQKYDIPTGKFKAFSVYDDAIKYLKETNYPVVIKVSGLAQGKGVYIVNDYDNAKEAITLIMKEKKFGTSGDIIIIEEMLYGKEVSILAFTDGNTIVPMVSAMDYKKIYDDDKGLNTGGMGNVAPNPYINDRLLRDILEKILKPLLNALKREGIIYKGILYGGLILTREGPKVLEFNVRFGDPEAQVILPLLKTDLVDIIEAIIENHLERVNVEWYDKKAVCVVASSMGYPGKYEKGYEIVGLNDIKNVLVFHSGTLKNENKYITSSGRVISVTAIENSYNAARQNAYNELMKIHFNGMYYRKDIGLF